MVQVRLSLEDAITSVVESIDPYSDLDGTLLFLENILQKFYRLNGILSSNESCC